jgi:Rrf2 family protein
MFKLNRKVEYALIALKHMFHKRPGELTTAKEIADTYGCSFDTISRVLQIMAHKNWLQSSHGAQGGYLIIKDLERLSFYDLSAALLGPIKLVRCLTGSCKIKDSCNIVSPVQVLNQHLIEVYKDLSVYHLLQGEIATKRSQIRSATNTSPMSSPRPSLARPKETPL